jgi:hypothetical protein
MNFRIAAPQFRRMSRVRYVLLVHPTALQYYIPGLTSIDTGRRYRGLFYLSVVRPW